MIKLYKRLKYRCLKVAFLIVIFGYVAGFTSFAQALARKISRVDPTFWWVEMKHDTLQLLVRGENLSGAKVSINTNQFLVANVLSPENSNYIFVDLVRMSSLQAGTLELTLTWPDTSIHLPYLLKKRDHSFKPSGLDASDIIYLIMPDRFANGDESNDNIPEMRQPKVDRKEPFARHGGDIRGIVDHLDYLHNLKMTALWLNPVEVNDEALESYHGYAITDHYKVDPRLGSNKDYQQLSDKLHEKGMKLIRDIVLNHFGDGHYLITDPPMKGWINEWDTFEQSNFRAPVLMDPHASKADIEKFSKGWFDHHMPDMNLDNPYLAKYLIQNAIWWIENFRIDAYRIDTYAYANDDFMHKWSAAIDKEYPGFFLFAETWVHGAAVQAWFAGGSRANSEAVPEINSVTDFQLNYALTAAFTEPFGWTEGVSKVYYTLAKDFLYRPPDDLVIFLDNHDLPRFAGVVNNELQKIKAGIALLMTMRGIPQVLYGTEIGMHQTKNHGLIREDFPGGWPADTVDYFSGNSMPVEAETIQHYFTQMSAWRKSSKAVTRGDLLQFVPENGLYVYFRKYEDEAVMVVLNASPKSQSLNLSRFEEMLGQATVGNRIPSGNKITFAEDWNLKPYEAWVVTFDSP